MTSKRTITKAAMQATEDPVAHFQTASGDAKLYTEDGWIFREQPGKGIECLSRYDGAESVTLAQPNLARHDYPST
jgi:hypothetical protein